MSPESATLVEIVAVGRELLTGHTVDTNSAWLAASLVRLGARVSRIAVVDDDVAAIAAALDEARGRGVGLVVTTGGLGPTADDCTLAGIAAAFGGPLEEHPAALAFVARRYGELAAAGAVSDGALTPARRKMAALPAGAQPLDNPVGSAPGVLLNEGNVTVIALPGVPAEMRAVFEAATPHVRARLGAPGHVAEREVLSGLGDESIMAAALERVAAMVPGVYLKSLATTFSPTCDLRVRITARGADTVEAEARAARAVVCLTEELARLKSR
jgi:molybdenum cofactor synthesis domain-containing protein